MTYGGETALHDASLRGHSRIVRVLLEHGANANAQDRNNDTALHNAAHKNHLDAVRLLIERGKR